MKTRISKLTSNSALMTIALLLWGSAAFASTLLVDDDKTECPDAGFNKIQDAVDAATPGDTIQVCSGTYDEQVEIAKPLSLVGVPRHGKNAAVVQPSNVVANADFLGSPNAAMILVQNTSGVTIKDITIDGINNGVVCSGDFPFINGIFFRNASGKVESVVIKNLLSPEACAFGDGFDILATEGEALQITIKDSSIHDYDVTGILGFGAGVSLSAIKNVVTGRAVATPEQRGIDLDGGANGSIEENIVTNNFNPNSSGFISHNIGLFGATHSSVVGNIVGFTNFAIEAWPATGVSFRENRIFNASFAGFFIVGDDNVLKDNSIANSAGAALQVQGANNTIEDNTINEASVGLLFTTGNNVLANRFFNTPRIKHNLR
jgi:nitrous oxidase accessory protein NosD